MHKEYYVFRRPNAMKGHKFTDDVAVCKAVNLGEARRIFSRYYAGIKDDEVFKLTGNLNSDGFLVLTDY